MKKRLLTATISLSLLASVLAGCGSSSGNSASSAAADSGADTAASTTASMEANSGESESATAPATDKLVIWSYMNEGEPIGNWQQEVTDKYKEEYPDVDVEIVYCGREILTQFQTKLQDKDADDFPDLISQGTGTMKPLAAKGQFMCIDDYLANEKNYDGDKTWGDTFVPQLLKADQVDGKNYFIPEDLYTHGFFYDANMFEKYGLSVPTTWDEFINVCDTLKKNGIAPVALDGTTDDYNAWWFVRFAERLAGVEDLQKAAQGQISWKDNPRFLSAAEYVYSFQKNGYFQDGFEGSVFPAAQALFTQGSCGMLFCGAWIPVEMASQTPDTMKMRMFSLPVLPDSVSDSHEEIWCNCFGITADAKNVQNAINWLKIYSSQEEQNAKIEYKDPSPLVGADTVPELDQIENIVNNATTISDEYAGLKDYGDWFTSVLYPLSTKLITGAMTPEDFISQLDADTTTFYSK